MDNYFSQNLQYLLDNNPRGYQREIADKVGIDPAQLSQIKKGKTNVYLDKAARLCEALGESVDDMLYVDIKARDIRLHGELLKKIPIKKRALSFDEEIVCARQKLVSDKVYKRFEGKNYYVYYYSGTEERKFREGTLELFHRRPKSSLVPGILHTSQDYRVKLIVEHPLYVYVFGTSRDYSERLALMLHEPKARNDEKPYIGGIGVVVMEGSSGEPTAQRMCVSLYAVSEENLKPYLTYGQVEVSSAENRAFYDVIKKNKCE